MTGTTLQDRMPALDGVRGLAILMVVLLHAFKFQHQGAVSGVLHQALAPLWLGVDLFFVLSGFLITRLLIQARGGAHYFRYFYARRALRIWPAYYLVVAVVLLLYPLRFPGLDLSTEAPYLLLHLQNWYPVFNERAAWPGIAHFWSLAIEEQFYLAWPLVVLLTPPSQLARLCLALWAGSAACRLVLWHQGVEWQTFYMVTFSHLDGIAAGAWIAASSQAGGPGPTALRLLRCAAVASFTLLLAFIVAGWNDTGFMAVAIALGSIAFAGLVYQVQAHDLPASVQRALVLPWLTWLGRYSYGIYLLHLVVLIEVWQWLEPLGGSHNLRVLASGVLGIGLTLVLARLMHRYVEAPALRQARRFRDDSPATGRP